MKVFVSHMFLHFINIIINEHSSVCVCGDGVRTNDVFAAYSGTPVQNSGSPALLYLRIRSVCLK